MDARLTPLGPCGTLWLPQQLQGGPRPPFFCRAWPAWRVDADSKLVKSLYEALQRRDGDAMAACYADDARFNDPVFGDLNGDEVGGMWRMLCKRAVDLDVKLRDLHAKAGFVSATWECRYLYGSTGRPVVNIGQARFAVRDGKIMQHVDEWSFHAWAGQALGWKGKSLGWTKPFQAKVQDEARARLRRFMDDGTV